MKYKKLVIEYGDDYMPVEYSLLDYDIVQRWAERITTAQRFPYTIDHPNRFYGFDSIENQIKVAIADINSLCDSIENYDIVVERRLSAVTDQDTLNYLHHIFETYHGLLDAKLANSELEKKLCELNIAVHRCESIQRGAKPRHVVTYFGLPKTQLLLDSDYQHFTNEYQYGTVYLNYAEIGKTLEDLTLDNDQYISDEAFRPFRHYTADFNVKFYTSDTNECEKLKSLMSEYYYKNFDFFQNKGFTVNSPYLKPGSVPVAQIQSKLSLDDLTSRQCVKSVTLYE